MIFYKAHQFQKDKDNKGAKFEPNIDISCFEHLSIWIIRSNGFKAEDGSYRIRMTKNDFKTKLIPWLEQYINQDGQVMR